MNPSMEVIFGGFLGVTDGKISYIGKNPPKDDTPAAIVDATGMVVMPGLINCHTKLATTVLRSFSDDLTQREALEQQLLKEDKMDSRCAKAAALLGIAECLRFGITSVSDLYYFPYATAEALAETGMKGNVALSAYRYIDVCEEFDFETDEQCRELQRVKDTWHGYDGGRVKVDAGFYAEYISNYPLWEGMLGYAAEQGLGMQFHLSQTQEEADSCLDRTGMTPGELLSCHNVFRVPVTAAGCNALTPEERKILGRQKVTAVALPLRDAKCGHPATPITESVQAGMNVALGTGGVLDCGNLDLFEVMRGAAFSQRVRSGDSAALPAPALLMMATVCGARAQGREAECGMLQVGMDADLILVDFTAPHLMPCHNVLSALVFSAKGGDVAMTMVRGKILYRSGTFPTIDLPKVVAELQEYAIPRLFAQKD